MIGAKGRPDGFSRENPTADETPHPRATSAWPVRAAVRPARGDIEWHLREIAERPAALAVGLAMLDRARSADAATRGVSTASMVVRANDALQTAIRSFAAAADRWRDTREARRPALLAAIEPECHRFGDALCADNQYDAATTWYAHRDDGER
jgi:hypothetical protein